MYIDGVIIFSLVVVALIFVMMFYIARYAKKHIRIDTEKAKKEAEQRRVIKVYAKESVVQ